MLTSEEVREIELRVAADYACLDAPGFRDSLAARRDVAALLKDRAELEAENERLRAVVEAAREGCDTCHKYNGDDYCCDCYHAGSGTWDALCAWKEGK
jgi:hypothetical protein